MRDGPTCPTRAAVFVTVPSLAAASPTCRAPAAYGIADGFHVAVLMGALIASLGVFTAAMLPNSPASPLQRTA
jgi:hypothetical protein